APFEERIGGHRGAHLDAGDLPAGDRLPRIEAHQARDAGQRRVAPPAILGQHLGRYDAPIRPARDDIREGAAAVDPEVPLAVGRIVHPLAPFSALKTTTGRDIQAPRPAPRFRPVSTLDSGSGRQESEMHGTWLGAMAALALLVSTGMTFAACGGTEILFEDRFDTLQPTWGSASESFKVEDRHL